MPPANWHVKEACVLSIGQRLRSQPCSSRLPRELQLTAIVPETEQNGAAVDMRGCLWPSHGTQATDSPTGTFGVLTCAALANPPGIESCAALGHKLLVEAPIRRWMLRISCFVAIFGSILVSSNIQTLWSSWFLTRNFLTPCLHSDAAWTSYFQPYKLTATGGLPWMAEYDIDHAALCSTCLW